MTVEQALVIISSIPNGREALQCLVDDQGWVADTELREFLYDN